MRKKKILIVGRGPSAYGSNYVNEDEYDLVVKLKMCNCTNSKSKRCDVLVFYSHELNVEKDTLTHLKLCNKRSKPAPKILIFNPFSESITSLYHEAFRNAFVETMNNSYLEHMSEKYGLKFRSPPRLTTGLATILHYIHNYPKHSIDIIGFDNLVKNINVGHFDDESKTITPHHSIQTEHLIIKSLCATHSLNII